MLSSAPQTLRIKILSRATCKRQPFIMNTVIHPARICFDCFPAAQGTRPGFFSVFKNSSPRGAGRLTMIVLEGGAGMGGRSAPGKALKAIARCASPARTLEKVADE